MSKKLKKIFKIIVDFLTLTVFGILVIIIAAKFKMMISGKDYFSIFGYSVFTVATGSMEPAIYQNDIIVVKETSNYDINDIITYKSDDAYITHRIISIRENSIITKGDANNTKDSTIDSSAVIGKVIKIIPKAGIWQKIFTSPKIIIMIFITLMLFDFAFSYKGFRNKKNTKIVEKIKDIKLEQVNEKKDSPKMTNEEIANLYKKTDLVKNGEEVKFDKKEKEFLNYTIRLDLNELQKQIDNKMNEE